MYRNKSDSARVIDSKLRTCLRARATNTQGTGKRIWLAGHVWHFPLRLTFLFGVRDVCSHVVLNTWGAASTNLAQARHCKPGFSSTEPFRQLSNDPAVAAHGFLG